MAYTCQYCATLSIYRLVELAREDFSVYTFSPRKYFAHHKSIDDLDASAQKGCGLCRLIVDCFKGTSRDLDSQWPNTWEGPDCPATSSLYGQIKESYTETDIKLCINTRTLNIVDPLEKAAVLDQLLVQVGFVPDFDGEILEDYFEFFTLALNTTADEPHLIDGLRIGNLQVEEDLGSTANFSIAKAWLHECQTSHSTCHLRDLPQLPTRVIDVGQDDLDVPRIVTSRGVKASYVALSHCWGGNIPVLLTTETIADFQKALPLPELSQNFRDAIQITQKLGIRFLWIDSLCILQNSKSDWQSESRQMGRIYRDSTLTIYAAAADRSTAGILCQKARQYSRLPKPAYIALRPRSHDLDQEQQLVKVSWLPPEEEDLKSIYSDSPLYSRGWCLQESILAPRQLIYGARQLYWRCQAEYQSADGTPEGLRYPDINYKHFTSLIFSEILTAPSPYRDAQSPVAEIVEAVMKDYYDLVETYNLRTLTYGSDKLPAFSGLARLLQPILPANASYLAGLWSTDMHHGLPWRAEFPQNSTHVGTNPYRAPSWSWAVTDSLIHFPSSRSGYRPNPLNMEIMESHIVLQNPEDPFGEIVSAAIRVRARVIRLVRSSQVEHVDINLRIGTSTFDHEDERAEDRALSMFGSLFSVDEQDGDGTFILSIRTERGEATEFEIDTTYFPSEAHDDMLIMLVSVVFDEDDTTSGCGAGCLILQRTKETMASNAYERFGFAEFEKVDLDWLMGWDSVVLDLI